MPLSFNVIEMSNENEDLKSFDWFTPRYPPWSTTLVNPFIRVMQLHCYQTISLFRLKACDVAYIGLREVDPEETQIIQDLDMQAFSMRDVDELGIREVLIGFN